MRGFLDDLERTERPHHPQAMSDFRTVLDQADRHPSQRYFILKSIVLNNLYGVDIMEEAVEICKLRLFLKLVAQLESYEQIEPLPDIDFNIRAGNTLVGFTSLADVERAMTISATIEPVRLPGRRRPVAGQQFRALDEEQRKTLERIEEDAEIASRAFNQFREQQTALGGEVTPGDKAALRSRFDSLREELDRYMAAEYGVTVKDSKTYDRWRSSHQPFHWFVEFYGIMSKGGFDVVVGNPPYVEYSRVKSEYTVKDYQTESCGNLYAMMWERSVRLSSPGGHLGFIVPVSAVCTDGYAPLRELLTEAGDLVVSNFNDRPSKLFDGIEHSRLSIILLNKGSQTRRVFSTAYNKWQTAERDALFQKLALVDSTGSSSGTGLVKHGDSFEASILRKVNHAPVVISKSAGKTPVSSIYYTRKLSYFVQILDFVPAIYNSSGDLRKPSELKEILFDSQRVRDGVLGILNSSLFYWLITTSSDCRNLNKREIEMARFDTTDEEKLARLGLATHELMADIKSHSKMQTITYKKMGTLKIQSTYPRLSKTIIDKLDIVLAQHFGFTDEELDFIINYDIKYRMGMEK